MTATASASAVRAPGPSEPVAPYPVAARRLLRESLFAAARDQLQQRAWSQITMAEIARAAGVSRQTLYKTFGTRDEFTQALVIHEGGRFLDGVEAAVREQFDDSHAAVRAGLEVFLRTASEDPMVRRILLSDDGAGGVLRFVTTQGMPVVQWATSRLASVIRDGWPDAREDDVQLLGESLVRLAISYLTAPGDSPEATAAAASRLLGPFLDRQLAPADAR